VIDLQRSYVGTDLRWTYQAAPLELVAGFAWDQLQEERRGFENFVGTTLGERGNLRRDEENEVRNLDPYLQAVWKPTPAWTLTAGVRRSSVRFESRDRYIVGVNGDDSGSLAYSATLPVGALMYELSPQLHVYGAAGRGFETPTFNELAYRPDGSAGFNAGLRPSRSRNLELGFKGRSPRGATLRSAWTAAVFQTDTQDEIVTQTNTGGRTTFQNAGKTRRRGLELSWAAELRPGWKFQLAHTWLDARYRDTFLSCAGTPCTTPTPVPAGNRIPGTARVFSAAELLWEPPQGWRYGVEWRRSGRVFVNDANSDAAGAWNTFAGHVGYRWVLPGWTVDATGRVDNVFDRRYAGSVIVNEGNQRYFESAPGRQYVVKVNAARAF
jgi:iron complex outermembrane receptor protein